jgi:hypothetical protein
MSEHEIDDDGDGGKLLETVPLSPKELAFCEAFGNPESETFGNARKSSEVAGYSEPHNAGWKLRRRPRIIAKLKEYHAAVTVAVGRVLADLENERRLAVEKGDIASAIRATELMGKHLGMFRDVLDIGESEETVARYERRRASDLRIVEALVCEQPALPEARPVVEQELQSPRTRQERECGL